LKRVLEESVQVNPVIVIVVFLRKNHKKERGVPSSISEDNWRKRQIKPPNDKKNSHCRDLLRPALKRRKLVLRPPLLRQKGVRIQDHQLAETNRENRGAEKSLIQLNPYREARVECMDRQSSTIPRLRN